jgi:hypothetical protein
MAVQEQIPSLPGNTVLCPVCGRAMKRQNSIQPKGRHPP